MNGVSAVIATILMLIITIGLAGTAYVYISGMLTGKTEKTISVLDASCDGTGITLVIANDGTITIGDNDITVYINNQINPTVLTGPLNPHNTTVLTGLNTGLNAGESNTVLIISPSNSVRQSVWCS